MSANIAAQVNENILKKTLSAPLAAYTQANCQVTLTDTGYRIYRPPNLTTADNGNTMWGGFVMRFTSPPFIKGHRYIITFETKGQTSNAPSDGFGWHNNVGWDGGGLVPSPSNVQSKNIGANFNSSEWTLIAYAWTINDDVYKTCTTAYSSFVQGTVYPSYRDFKWGFGYTSTGALGTDLYIRNVRMFDITDKSGIDLTKEGILRNDFMTESISPHDAQFVASGEIISSEFYEL